MGMTIQDFVDSIASKAGVDTLPPSKHPLGMDAFTRAQYEWGCVLPRRSHSPRR
jgi:hypothetical protein